MVFSQDSIIYNTQELTQLEVDLIIKQFLKDKTLPDTLVDLTD